MSEEREGRSWGERVREERDRIGITQEDLAVRLGVSWTTVSRWERGAAVPSARKQAALLKVLREGREGE